MLVLFLISNIQCLSWPWKNYPPIESTKEFITGKWNVILNKYYPNGDEISRPSEFFIKSYRKNIGNTVYGSIYNITKSKAHIYYTNYTVEFNDPEETNATINVYLNGTLIESNNVKVEVLKDSSRKIRGEMFNKQYKYSIDLLRDNTMKFTLINNKTRCIFAFFATRYIPGQDAENPLKWYHVVSLIGMFSIFIYSISQPVVDENGQVVSKDNQKDNNKKEENNVSVKKELKKDKKKSKKND